MDLKLRIDTGFQISYRNWIVHRVSKSDLKSRVQIRSQIPYENRISNPVSKLDILPGYQKFSF